MGTRIQYKVPFDDDFCGYTISNGRLDGCESIFMEFGDCRYPPIVIKSYKGKTPTETYEEGWTTLPPMSVWKNAIKGKSAGKWILTSLIITRKAIDFNFDYKNRSKEHQFVTIEAKSGIEIYLEVPRNDGLPSAKYFIDVYGDSSGCCFRVTELYDRMKRVICEVDEPNPWYNSAIHSKDLESTRILKITEYRD